MTFDTKCKSRKSKVRIQPQSKSYVRASPLYGTKISIWTNCIFNGYYKSHLTSTHNKNKHHLTFVYWNILIIEESVQSDKQELSIEETLKIDSLLSK